MFEADQQDFIKDELERLQEEYEDLRLIKKKVFKKEYDKIKKQMENYLIKMNLKDTQEEPEFISQKEKNIIVKLGAVNKDNIEDLSLEELQEKTKKLSFDIIKLVTIVKYL